jgi:chromosome segregation ATPase
MPINTEQIEELQEKVDELETTIADLTEELTSVKDDYDNLREEFEEYVEETKEVVRQMKDAVDNTKRFLNVSYRVNHMRDTLEVKARITRDMVQYGGVEALDGLYQNMREEIMEYAKNPNSIPRSISY